MVRVEQTQYQPEYDIVPQAIFWRPLRYFTTAIRIGEDDLDTFQAASFIIGNRVRFDLRRYKGHPEFTVTLYLPLPVEDFEEIKQAVSQVIAEMAVPQHAVAWRRGQSYAFGGLQRPARDRIREPEARLLALKIASKCPNRSATTEYIKDSVPDYVELSEQDRMPSNSRGNEERWRQIVGNVVSHSGAPSGPFAKNYAVLSDGGLSVTREGLAYLNSMGFAV